MKIHNFTKKMQVPEGLELTVNGSSVSIKGKAGAAQKTFRMPRFTFAKEGNTLIVSCPKYGIYDKEKMHSVESHVENLIKGSQTPFVYQLKICSSHFPMTVTVSGSKPSIKNLLGEKVPREMMIKQGVAVKVADTLIEVTGPNLELVAQVAADIEQLTRIKDRDRRVFQDGIYITSKAGELIQ